MLVRTAERPPATDAVYFPWLRWRSVSLGLRDIGGVEDLCLSVDESAGSDTVFPLGEPDLYLTFAAISTPQDALAFARRYGLLGEFERGRFATFGVIEPARIWFTHAELVSRVLQVWERLQLPPPARRASLRECIHWQAADYVVARFQGNITVLIAWQQGENARWLKRWTPGELEGPARLFIADEITRQLHQRATVQVLPRDFGDSLQQVLTPVDLLAGIWVQVAQLVTGVRQARRCEACGQLFDVTGSRSHKRIHDSCSLRLRMARYRAKKAKKKEAKSNGTKTRKR